MTTEISNYDEGTKQQVTIMIEAANAMLGTAKGINITNMESCGQAGDVVTHIKKNIKDIETERRSWVDPLNEIVKRINSRFKPAKEVYDQALKTIKTKQNTYLQNEKIRQAEEMRKEKEAAEAAALKVAENLEAAGMKEEAEQVLDNAAEATVETAKPVAHGVTGATTSMVTVWRIKIVDHRLIPDAYLAVTQEVERVRPYMIPVLSIDGRKIKQAIEAGMKEIPGIEIIEDSEVRNR